MPFTQAQKAALVAQVDALRDTVAALQPDSSGPLDPPAGDQPPSTPPGGQRGFPDTYTVPTYQELAFGDVGASCATYSSLPQIKGAPLQPGYYVSPADGCNEAAAQFERLGGDWIDADGVKWGTKPWASALVTARLPHGTEFAVDWDITNLVRALAGGLKNYGFDLRGDALSNTSLWRSRFAAINTPVLDLVTVAGSVTLPCRRSAWLSSSSSALGGSKQFNVSGSSNHGLLWFDLSAYTDPAAIVSATLRCWTYDQYGNMSVGVFRVSNPADQSGMPPQELGLAAAFADDAGIESHPAVLMVERFADRDINPARWIGRNGDAGEYWDLIPAPAPLTGNAMKVKFRKANGVPSAVEYSWSPNRGPNHIKTLRHVGELYTRFYLYLPDDWNPSPDGGKAFAGFDMRHCDINVQQGVISRLGMGRGNSGSYCDGITGGSARAHFGKAPAYDHPLKDLRTFSSSDLYNCDQTDLYGFPAYWDKQYLGALRKGGWNCIEQRLKQNSVSNPNAKPVGVASVTRAGAIATGVLKAPNPTWVPGTTIVASIGGCYEPGFNYSGPISVVDQSTFTYPVLTTLPAAASVYQNLAINSVTKGFSIWLVESVGIKDGVLEAWVNGRKACSYTNFRYWHTAWLPDGVTPASIDAVWLCWYHGGQASPDSDFSVICARVVVATEYIGPMVVG